MQGTTSKLRSQSMRSKSGKAQQQPRQSLQIIPSEVVFKDIQINQLYEITVEIRNLTHRAKRIRIDQCTNANFSVIYNMQPQIASGLSMTAKIKYLCKELKNQTQIIKVVCDEGSITQLPVRVYKTQSQIVFEPFVNLGFVKCGKEHEERIVLKNIGKAAGRIEFSHCHGAILSVEPSSLTIPEKKQTFVTIKFKTSQAGLFKGQIYLKSQSILVKDKIDIHATAVEFARYVVDSKGGQSASFDFRNLYAGQEAVLRGFVVNNSPKAMAFKAVLRRGYLVSSEEFALTQTPAEIGQQQSEKIMFMQPQHGIVEPFGQIQIKFTCRSKVSYKDRVYTKTFALTSAEQQGAITSKKNSSEFKPQNLHQYSVMMKVQQDEPIILQLKAVTVCPQIKLQRELFQFGDCFIKDTKQEFFWVQNKSQVSKAEISFNKIPNFVVFPNSFSLRPLQKIQVKIQFEPKTIGKFDVIQKLMINKIYQLDLRLFGIATQETKSMKKLQELTDTKKKQPINTRLKAFSVAEKSFMSEIRKSTVEAQKSKLQLSELMENREKFNVYLKERRTDRMEKHKEEAVQKRWSLYQTKLKDLGPAGRLEEKFDQQGNPINPPIDYEFESGMNDTRMNRQQIALPQVTEKLFVTKHINDYEPLVETNKREKFSRGQTQAPRQVLTDTPVNYNHRREITSELSPEELSLIEVMSNVVEFGDVYIKSKERRYFWVRNLTKKAVSIEVRFSSPQLKNSYQKPQILKSAEQAGFEVVFCKDTLGEFKAQGKYIINGIYEFQMTVTAKSTPVQIELNTTELKFHFDQCSLEFSTQKQLKLYNPGNGAAFFKFLMVKERVFVPKVLQGTLQAKQSLTIPISLTVPNPTVKKNEHNYSQRLVLKVLDGPENPILCTYSNADPKFSVKCDKFLAKPVIYLGHDFEDSIDLKNQSKNAVVILIEANNNLQVYPNRFRLAGDESKKVNIKFQAKIIGEFNIAITIVPRGGQKKVIESLIKVVEPALVFSSEHINMGTLIVQGVAGQGKFTLSNKNDIPLPLIIDIRPRNICSQNPANIESMTLKLVDSQQALQVIAPQKNKTTQQYSQGENLVGQNVDEEELQNSDSEEEEIVEKNQEEYRKFRLVVKPQKTYTFQVQFYPKETGNYEISIPMHVEHSIKIDNSPAILCQAIKPQFIFQPSIVDFKRKIVTKPDRCYPKFISVMIQNIDQDDVTWELDDREIQKEGIFQVSQVKGTVKAGEKLQIKVSFNPYQVGEYHHKLPLFIHSAKITQPLKYVDVVLKGTASLPNIFFNKRQVIMPVVPLGIETFSSFRIINDGYENCNLKCQFVDDVAGINVKVHFPEGSNIGITRQKLKVDLSWKFAKPMSFCLKLEFVDDMNRSFIIPVSGTTDNCIFTNYTFFLRNEGKFKIKNEGVLQLVESNENAASSMSLQRKNSAHSLKSNATNKSVMSYLGVPPINQSVLTNTLNYVLRYLNANLLTSPIHQFPQSLIQSDGQQLFEIIAFVSNKPASYPWKYSGGLKGVQKVNKLFEQYNQLVKLLKVEGAHLNHIRPEYLLSFNDLNVYLGSLPQEKAKCYMPSLLKINRSLYNYLSIQSWITLLYQVFKIYVLTRVNPKNFKSHVLNSPQIPKQCLQLSNFSSTHQNILFFWVEQAINQVLLQQRRLTNFDKDFRDGIAIGALLKKYANNEVLKKMKMICSSQEEFKANANVLCEALKEIGLLNHVVPRDVYSPTQREMLLFILNLYVYLPFYVPKQEPITFKCILGQEVTRNIQLTNPSTKPVMYEVKYQGSEDFKLIGQKRFRLQPKETYKYEVRFVSRVSAQVRGRIMFINVKENSLTAAPLVFDLRSQITGKVSDRIWNISGVIYQQIEFNIDVANKFLSSEVVDFAITYETEYVFENLARGKGKGEKAPLQEEEQVQTIYGKVDNVKIRKNGTVSLTLNYIPTSLYTTRTVIYFSNAIVGEFQHEIIGVVEPPSVSGEIRPPMGLTVDQVVNWEFVLNPKNDMIARAKKAIEGLKKRKGAKQEKQAKKNAQNFINEQFTVEIAPNPYVSAKQTIFINQRSNPTQSDKSKDPKNQTSKRQLVDSENKIPFTIVCKNPVYQFSNYVLIYNKAKTDVRRYRITFTVQPKPLKAILQMNVPARGEVTQNLPIVNNTDRDWAIKIQWQPDMAKNGQYFVVPGQYTSMFPVKKQSIGNFPITFRPKWTNRAEARLIMTNPLTLDHFEYDIIGNGEDPLAQDHIDIRCQAKERVKKEIYVRNPYSQKPINLRVEADLLNCQVPPKLTIPSGAKEKFEFYVQPMLCGQYTGSITFYQEQGPQYLWYTVSLTTNYPEPYKTVDLCTELRGKVVEKLYLPYKESKQHKFQVIINGNGLGGAEEVLLKPNADNFYCVEYLPLEVGEEKGSIIFINPDAGQILYEFNLRCLPKPPTIINDIKSPLGVSAFIKLQLQNPINRKVLLNVFNTNPEQFVLKDMVIKLQPYEKKIIEVEYIPASLDKIESGVVTIKSKEVGEWAFELSGSGLPPVPFEPKVVYNGIFQQHSDSVKFRNPFKYEIMIGIKLVPKSPKDTNIFKLLNMSKTKFSIESFGVLEIPFSFIPPACSRYFSDILVMISEKIYWTFPIVGVTEINKGVNIASLSTQCRQSVSSFAQIQLEGVENFKENNQYSLMLENVPTIYQKLVEKTLAVDLRKDRLNHANDALQVQFSFKPMKPLKVSFDVVITRKQGSRWRYKLNIEGLQPEPDDVIEIESNLLVTTTVSFKLTNWQKTSTNFKAKFTSDSAHEFSVEPKQGVLAKYGSKGTTFYVSFTPVEYGKQKRGKLIIETNDMYWSYVMKGSLPKYIPPKTEIKRSRISSSIK